jgi:hypothetical protein
MRTVIVGVLTWVSVSSWGADVSELSLSPKESEALSARLKRFADGDVSVMKEALPRHSLDGIEVPVSGNTRAIIQSLCRGVAKRYFPGLAAGANAWEAPASYDRLNQLTQTWIDESRLSWDPAYVPLEGKTKLSLWSGDYWALRNGATSYRYAENKWFTSYEEAVGSYDQPGDWRRALSAPLTEMTKVLHLWSPAEKWDVTVGDDSFSLTRNQKKSGERYKDELGDVPAWMGLCHGWAAAAIGTPRPDRAVDIVGAGNAPVRWLPDEIRSMVTLAWANAEIPTNFVGGRCDEKEAATFPNGRLRQPECFDTNPSTFYLALGNLIGRQGSSFVMDVSFDHQVWNQPVAAYWLTYFDPTDPTRVSDDWRTVMVDYDGRFKAKDRFQKPLTRGMRGVDGRYDDRGIKKIIGVAATVGYLVETRPSGEERPAEDLMRRMTFTFDLELYERNGHYNALGGEWHENAHPDFLWVPKAGVTPYTAFDQSAVSFNGKAAPSAELTRSASAGSRRGYPICRVLKALIDESSGTRTYRCGA